MATVVNFIDTTLQSAPSRTINAPNADVLLNASTNGFHVNNAGANDPASITFTYSLIALDGPAIFSSTGCTITTAGNVATLTYANMLGSTASVTASVTVNGQTYSKTCVVTKVLDGATGATGATGPTGAAGSTGATGGTGAEGASYVTAYCASATATTTTAPAATTGKTSLPATNSGGIVGTYSSTVPALTAGQFMYQTDGIYNPATNQVTWSIPYWSSLKVGSLSAITANLGAITAGSIDLGTGATSWHFDAAGNEWAGASTYGAAPYRRNASGDVVARSLAIQSAIGDTVLDGAGLKPGYEAPGTKNSDQTLGALGFTGDTNATFSSPSQGAAINDDPALEKASAWSLSAGISLLVNPGGAGVVVGPNYFWTTGYNGTNRTATSARNFVIDPSKTYSLTANLYAATGNDRSMFVFINFYDAAGTFISTGWGGTLSGYAYSGTPPTNTWSRQGAQIGAGTSKAIPSNAATANIGVWFQYTGSGSSSVGQAAQDIRLEPVLGTSLLDPTVNAAITAVADKLSKSAASILAAPITVSTGGAIQVGTAAWTGSSATGSGVVVSPKGIAGVNAGVVTFAVDAITGAAVFGGALTAANMVGTSHMVNDSITTTDIFSSGLPAPGYAGVSFVVTRTSKVLIIAKFNANGSNFWVGDSVSTSLGNANGNAGEYAIIPLTLSAGTYYIGTNFGGASFAYVLKVMV